MNWLKKGLKFIKNIIITGMVIIAPLWGMLAFIPKEVLSAMDNRIDILALGVSLYSLEMSIAIAFLIYWLETRDSKKEETIRKQKARCMMYSELENALEGVYRRAAGCGSISTGVSTKDIMNTYLVELQDILTADQFRLLIGLVNKIDVESNDTSEDEYRAETARDELLDYMHPWIAVIMRTKYVACFSRIRDYHDALDKPVFELLQVLGGTNAAYEDRNEIYGSDGNMVFRCKGCMEYQIYDDSGKLLLDGRIGLNESDRYAICEGYECSETYDGFYKDGKYSGKGILYTYNQEKRKEGIWKEGELQQGVEYNCLYRKMPDGSLEYQESYKDFIDPYFSVKCYMDEEEMKDYLVADDFVDGEFVMERKNIRSLKSFFDQLRN